MNHALLVISRLLTQLNEKEKEYQELVMNSLHNVQGAIDTLKVKAATESSGKYIYFCLQSNFAPLTYINPVIRRISL